MKDIKKQPFQAHYIYPIFLLSRTLAVPINLLIHMFVKLGSVWWMYSVQNIHDTSDLGYILPPSHYSDLSIIVRSVFLFPDKSSNYSEEATNYDIQHREMCPGYNIRSFLALCHGPKEEWSYGAT